MDYKSIAIIEAYLEKVGHYLLPDTKDRIIDQLWSDIHRHVDKADATLGRPPTPDELHMLLERYGDPITIAGRFAETNDSSWPSLFPL